jgi:hypothetical protein
VFLGYLTMNYGTALASARSAVSDAIPAAAQRIRAPALLVAARKVQSITVANIAYTAIVIPRCEVRWVARCSHLPMVERPDEYATLVSEFLGKQVDEGNVKRKTQYLRSGHDILYFTLYVLRSHRQHRHSRAVDDSHGGAAAEDVFDRARAV